MLGTHGENGGFQRLEANYELSDQARVKIGGVNYVSGNKAFFQTIGDNDRVYAKFECESRRQNTHGIGRMI